MKKLWILLILLFPVCALHAQLGIELRWHITLSSGEITRNPSLTRGCSGSMESGSILCYYKKDKKRLETHWKDNALDSICRYWYPNGNLREEGWFSKGLLHGQLVQYYETGGKQAVSQWENGVAHGPFEMFTPAGVRVRAGQFAHGKLEGPQTLYDSVSGARSIAYVCHNDTLTGTITAYHPNGTRAGEEYYSGGLRNGNSVYWNDAGHKTAEMHWKNGEPDGIQKQFDAAGNLSFEALYENGNKLRGTLWKAPGYRFREEQYEQDILRHSTQWDSLGRIQLEMDYDPSGNRITSCRYTYAQRLESRTCYDAAGLRHGWMNEYFDTGELARKSYYLHGSLDSVMTCYDREGHVTDRIHYRNNTRNGLQTTYYPNGVPQIEMYFVNGREQGPVIHHYENGQKALEATLIGKHFDGEYRRWHDNGTLERSLTYQQGRIMDPKVEIYSPEGKVIETQYYQNGVLVRTEKN